ncbi:anthranilate synthase component I [uncultured Megasphaera sp.]|uniref:anthranilate synthase component I n=1 Tax=uncultured Megasphaera sp. TaxID=165188 RepID=UPI002658CF14|nr:anthranilate synthase component I [uncultured Megasphaera sp.]
MMSLEQLKAYGNTYKVAPVSRRIFSDIRTPVEALRILKNVSSRCYLLESMEDAKRWGRYTFLGYDPQMELTCKDNVVHLKAGTDVAIRSEKPDDFIRQVLADNTAPQIEGMPPFTGGLVGYFSYDYIKYAEPSLKLEADDDEAILDFDLLLFENVIVFDNLKQQIILIANVRLDAPEENYHKALLELDRMEQLLRDGEKAEPEPLRLESDFKPLFSEDAYCGMVEKGKEYIREGDIFQVVLSNRLEARATGSLFDTYRVLRTVNPSPYMFYFSGDDLELAGSSPETLTRLQNGTLFTFPLAGTRPRGATPQEDEALEQELLHNPKELAEHNMLVDLGRNDLGRISEFGSVHVEKYLDILRFSHVMHIGSTVSSTIRPDKTAVDAIGSVLPAGTLSGAPKIRACQIIDELEGEKRGVYGGAIGYIDFTGNMDTCIGIRLAYKKGDRLFVRSGAGIVADSVPEKEYQECINKAKAVVTAIQQANGGIDK